tara:strand:- start:968 stop:1273 length:306 start_codon:yes stop_codon:yes gene_type:complete
MGGSVGDALSAVTQPMQQVAKVATDAVGATPLGGLIGATPVGKMLEGENPLDSPLLSPAKAVMGSNPLQGALGAGMGMAKKQGKALGGSLLTKNARRAMMG